jgi:hypothetical protein
MPYFRPKARRCSAIPGAQPCLPLQDARHEFDLDIRNRRCPCPKFRQSGSSAAHLPNNYATQMLHRSNPRVEPLNFMGFPKLARFLLSKTQVQRGLQ